MATTATITGNLGRDAELKFTPSGVPVLEFSVADTPRRKNDRGEWEDAGETAWFRVSVWGKAAEGLAESGQAVKGARATVHGRLTVRSFTGRDGVARQSLEVRADAVGFEQPRGASSSPSPFAQTQGVVPDPWSQQGQAPASSEPPF